MPVNNIEQIRSILSFNSDDEFYFLQVILRKKDNPDQARSEYIVNCYYIDSFARFDLYVPRIISECNGLNARAYIHLNKRSYRKVTEDAMVRMAKAVVNDQYKSGSRVFNTSCGKVSGGDRSQKTWIIDIDDPDYDEVYLDAVLNSIKPKGGDKVKHTIPTKSGVHIITGPFDLKAFNALTDYDVHKNSPTLLYCP